MNFCVITPTAGLRSFATRSHSHMVLAHQYEKDAAYREFYLERRAAGDFIFLDNGVYEDAYDERKHLTAIMHLRPHVAILPDIICKGPESLNRSLKFLIRYKEEFPSTQWMLIPQGRTVTEWYLVMQQVTQIFDEDQIWIGLTRFLPTHTAPLEPTIRVKLAQHLKGIWPKVNLHCMGMCAGSINELTLLAKQDLVTSIDSSCAVWRGWLGYELGADDKAWNKIGKEVDFGASLDDATLGLIESNLEVVFAACRK